MMTDETPDRRSRTAISAETFVEERSGRWYVGIAVLFDDGVVRKEINSYRSEREAEIAARYIKRAANVPGLRPAPEFGLRPNIADDESETPKGSDA